ncbi:hypothetical protein GGP41_001632 [Bipolaris sorokiniana]|uniref:Uncharacterized protein n=1 Tax=Cochliobolus sativus TaxID=45130 RepID=A0A8H5ZRV1_COCSA|nr:hypothetical protein GGP41_001632 [Bipolaris sorokiniana]
MIEYNIYLFLEHELSIIQQQILELVKLATPLFIYTATTKQTHKKLATCCLKLMSGLYGLHENMCNLMHVVTECIISCRASKPLSTEIRRKSFSGSIFSIG